MKRLFLACMLLATPAMAQDRWFLTVQRDGRAPEFDGPYSTIDACEATRSNVLRQNAEFVERQRPQYRPQDLYIARLERELSQLQRSTICERR